MECAAAPVVPQNPHLMGAFTALSFDLRFGNTVSRSPLGLVGWVLYLAGLAYEHFRRLARKKNREKEAA